ncbi:hypothetical protein, partial [Vibrio sonorensis]|uniref:hypothetical protein n=1 Tax=Vibrio sonorensis TaxID=1004316 RepID=UPI001C2FCF50
SKDGVTSNTASIEVSSATVVGIELWVQSLNDENSFVKSGLAEVGKNYTLRPYVVRSDGTKTLDTPDQFNWLAADTTLLELIAANSVIASFNAKKEGTTQISISYKANTSLTASLDIRLVPTIVSHSLTPAARELRDVNNNKFWGIPLRPGEQIQFTLIVRFSNGSTLDVTNKGLLKVQRILPSTTFENGLLKTTNSTPSGGDMGEVFVSGGGLGINENGEYPIIPMCYPKPAICFDRGTE